MERRHWRGFVRLGLALGVGALAFGVVPLRSGTQDDPEREHALTAASPDRIDALYATWRERHEALGGDRNVRIGLGTSRAHRSSRPGVAGMADLDLVAGIVRVDVTGLEADQGWEAWLVDNRPAPGASALLDPGDARLRVGRLEPDEGGGVSARAELGAEAFVGFEVDLVVVTPAKDPDSVIAYGTPSAFQRFYTRARTERLAAYAEGEDARVEPQGPGSRLLHLFSREDAHAAGIVADPDVVLDTMVATGADLFINETFDGNGRTCATCHPPSNNFTIDPEFIAELPDDDPLFVAETNPALAELEVPLLLRERALILENLDGFDRPGVLRSVPHTLSMSRSLMPPTCVKPGGCDIPLGDGTFATLPEGAYLNLIDGITPEASGFPPLSVDPLIEYPVQRTGWSGDGSPGSGSLREFAIGAVIQHAPKTLDRVPGADFRLPTDAELDALEVFQLSLGRPDDPDLDALAFTDPEVEQGRVLFTRFDTAGGSLQAGKCALCHFDGGAMSMPDGFGDVLANFGLPRDFMSNSVFDTGINNRPGNPTEAIAPGVAPRDGGFGIVPQGPGHCYTGQFDFSQGFPAFVPDPEPQVTGGFGTPAPPPFLPVGLCQELFNTPPLVEAADTAPFFHDNSIETLEEAVAFYASDTFNDMSLIQLFLGSTDSGGIGIQLEDDGVDAIASFLRVLNTLENLRQSVEFDEAALDAADPDTRDQLLTRALDELRDARQVLKEGELHAEAQQSIQSAIAATTVARGAPFGSETSEAALQDALDAMDDARAEMVADVP